MNLSRPVPVGKLLVESPEKEDDNDAERETHQHLAVLTIVSENLLGANGTPEYGCGEEGVDARASELILRVRCAHSINVQHLEVQHSNADDGTNQGGDHLSDKGLAWRNLDIVGELEIVGKPDGMGAGYVAKRLEIVHG